MSANFTPNQNDYKNLTPFKCWLLHQINNWGLTNFPFVESDFDELTNYGMLMKMMKALNDVISNQNEVEQDVTNLFNAFTELQTYVNDYLNSLNLQEEVNNKLDEMFEDGTLENIISGYITNDLIHIVNTANDLKISNYSKGQKVETLGYYEINDGGSALYYINDSYTENDYYEELENGNYAILIPKDIINVKVFGVHENESLYDDSDAMQRAFDYIGTHTQYLLKGNDNYCKITKTLELKVYSKIENINFAMYSGTFANNYLLYVNSNSSHNGWQVQYPYNDGLIKGCKFKNTTNENYNCIYNYSNGTFEGLRFSGFDVSLKVAPNYLDSYKISRIVTTNKKETTNYAIDLGYLGDQVEIGTLHLMGGLYQLNIGGGHNSIALENIIAHGIVNIAGSIVDIKNLHQEGGSSQIKIDNSIVNLTDGFLYHNRNVDEHNIEIKGSSRVRITNYKFNYDLRDVVDNSTDDIDINIISGDVDVINSYKRIQVPDIGENNLCVAKTNLALTLNETQHYSTINTLLCTYGTNQTNISHGLYYNSSAGSRANWKINTGTYYYKIQPYADFTRKLAYNNTISTLNATMTNGGSGYLFTLNPGMYRIYRGTSENNYNYYADVCLSARSLIDDGNHIGGYLWQPRTEGDSDAFTAFSHATYNGDNISFLANELPSIGTWNRGDVIYNNNPSATTKGWICIVTGTPGTWKSF